MESNEHTFSDAICFNSRHFINLGRNSIKDNQAIYGDFFIYNALLCPNIDLLSYLKCISIRSYVYYTLKDTQMLLVLSLKALKLFPQILLIEDSSTLSDVIKILNRTGVLLINDSNFNTIIPFYILFKAKQLIELNKYCKLNKSDLNLFNNTYEDAQSKHQVSLNRVKKCFENIIRIKTKEFINDKKEELYQILEEHMDKIDCDLEDSSIHPREECYLISNKWFRNYIKYLETILSIRDSPGEYINYINSAFDINRQCDYFAESEGNKEDKDIYIGPINNFWLIKHKEQWIIPNESYTNAHIKDKLIKQQYSIVRKEIWAEMSDDYEYINSIQRFKLTTGEIKIHLKEIRVMLLDKTIFSKQPSSIYPKSFQLSKEHTTYETIMSTIYSILKLQIPHFVNMYVININSMNRNKKKQLFIELIMAYSFNCCNVTIEGMHFAKLKQSTEEIENKDLIIIERVEESDNSGCFIKLKKKSQCEVCENNKDLIECTRCNMFLINKKYYCNVLCQKRDKEHDQYHNYMSSFMKYSIPKIMAMSLSEIIKYKNPNSINGLVGFRNLGNTCFLNSALQCLSHCEDLTKYFLLKQYKNDINLNSSNSTSGKIVKAYYNLIKRLWLGNKCVLSPTEFKGIFSLFVQQFADQNQHDSQEVLTFILDKIHEDLNTIHNKPYIEMNNHIKTDTNIEASDKWWLRYKRREDSIIVDLFHGQFKNNITCSYCNNKSITFDPFVFLSLPIPFENSSIQYKFFPLIKNKQSRNRKKKKKKNNYYTSTSITLLYKSYELALSNRTIINDFIIPIKKDNPDLNENCDFDFVVLKPNKQFHQLLTSSNKVVGSFDDLLNGYELCIYEKLDIYIQNAFVYPCDFIHIRKWLIIPEITVQFLSYPLAIPMSPNQHVRDLYKALDTYLQRILNNPENDLTNEEKEYSHHYKLYLYNTNCQKSRLSYSTFYSYLINFESNEESIQCNFCGNSECVYCSFLKRFPANESFDYIYSICPPNTPLILYAQILSYDRGSRIFQNSSMPLRIHAAISVSQNKPITIYDCLDLFTLEEHLDEDNKWYCSQCKTHREANKKLDLFTLPPYLIIQLKRFQIKSGLSFSYGKKNFTYVDFPLDYLDLRNYIQHSNGKSMQYELISISEHYGQLSSGHYVAECKNNSNWYVFNDSSVTKTTKESISKKSAYILFYKQKTNI